MTEIRTGCISWTYPDWIGSFYPSGSKSTEFFGMYSNVFDIVEVDSTFYHQPSDATVKQWKQKTPDNFLFTIKMPKRITHELKLSGIEKELERFEKAVRTLGSKLGAVMVQLPPFMKFDDSSLGHLSRFLDLASPDIPYAVEFRNKSWFRAEAYDLLRAKKVCFVWSVNEYVEGMPKEVTTDFIYLRFMGEFGKLKKLDRIQIDRTGLLEEWWNNLHGSLSSVDRAFVLVSNHFAGFAPATVNQFRRIAGLSELAWNSSRTA